MKIRRLHFGDFGILRNQTFDAIEGSPIVIAGANRAGKTTFMTALRYLAYGLPQGNAQLPGYVKQYHVQADVENDAGLAYNISLRGYGQPEASPMGHDYHSDTVTLFGGVDSFTYQQVFSISVDELRRLPEGINKRQTEDLEAILLGGGWSDVLNLEQIRAQLEKEYITIGGTRGKINVKQFGAFGQQIRQAQTERDIAHQQVEEYYQLSSQLKALRRRIPQLRTRWKQAAADINRLEILSEHYQRYQRLIQLEKELQQTDCDGLLKEFPANLAEKVKEAYQAYQQGESAYAVSAKEFAAVAAVDDPWAAAQKFLALGAKLDQIKLQLTAWRQRDEHFHAQQQTQLRRQQELKQSLQELCQHWRDPAVLNDVSLDLVNESELKQLISQHLELTAELKDAGRQRALLEQQLTEMDCAEEQASPSKGGLSRVMMLTAADMLLTLAVAVTIDTSLGMIVGLIGAMAIYINYQHQREHIMTLQREREAAQQETRQTQVKLDEVNSVIEQVKPQLETVSAKLTALRRDVGLPGNIAYSDLLEFCYKTRQLKREYRDWQEAHAHLQHQQQTVDRLTDDMKEILGELPLDTKVTDKAVPAEVLFAAMEKSVDLLDLARKLEQAAKAKKYVLQQLKNLLRQDPQYDAQGEVDQKVQQFLRRSQEYDQWSRAKQEHQGVVNALLAVVNTAQTRLLFGQDEHASAQQLINAFGEELGNYQSTQHLSDVQQQKKEDLTAAQTAVDDAVADAARLEQRIKEMSCDTKLLTANAKIIQTRKQLEPLAEKYATLRLATLMAAKLKEILMESTATNMFQTAGDMFSSITAGEYQQLLPPDAGQPLDFRVVTADGGEQTANLLSRATAEQLFLAVRLSRIQDIKPALPVIFDDSFVNFDPAHCQQVVNLIHQLSTSHQVFVLTCHPQLVREIAATAKNAQFWTLESGNSNGPFNSVDQVIKVF